MTIIYLVNAGNDASMASIANDYSFPPLNILALGTWLKSSFPELNVICRDSGIVGIESVLREIAELLPQMVGVGVLATSYKTALKIAKVAKKSEATTVFGNDQAAHLSKQILRNQPNVDFVIGAEYGEFALKSLVDVVIFQKGSFELVPSLTYRDEQGEIRGFDFLTDKQSLSIKRQAFEGSKVRKGALDVFPVPDRTLYPQSHWDGYLANYMSSFSHLHPGFLPKGVTTMNRARGCSRANENIKCKHCDMLLDISFSSAKVFWWDVEVAHEQVNAEIFYEVCDSLTSFPRFLESVVNHKPSFEHFDPKFFIYGQALDIVRYKELPNILQALGVFKINIGLEAGCDQTLKHTCLPGCLLFKIRYFSPC